MAKTAKKKTATAKKKSARKPNAAFMLHSRWMYTLGRMETFFRKFLGPDNRMTTASGK